MNETVEQTSPVNWLGRDCLGIVLLLLSVLACLAIYFLVRQSQYRQQLAAVIQAIRDSGDPVDGADLNARRKLPPGVTDITPEYLALLARMAAQFSGEPPFTPPPGTTVMNP